MSLEKNKSEYDYKPFLIAWEEDDKEKVLLIDGVDLKCCIELGRKGAKQNNFEIFLRNPYPKRRGKLIYTTYKKEYDEI